MTAKQAAVKEYVARLSDEEHERLATLAHKGRRLRISAKAALHDVHHAGYTILEITPAHGLAVERLLHLHRDPFDRMPAARALATPLRLLTHDTRVAR